MRQAVLSAALLQALLGIGPAAQAQHYEPAVPPGEVYGAGCYWFHGKHYCNRYCYLEVDGYYYCQPRLRDAGPQAPPPVVIVSPPYWSAPPRVPYAPRRRAPHPPGRLVPRP